MEKKSSLKERIKRSAQVNRQEIDLADLRLTQATTLAPDQTLPLVISPLMEGVSLPSWAKEHQEYIRTELAKHGGILFHNFGVDTPAQFEEFACSVSADGELFDEYGDLPRETKGNKVYKS